jgi:hypothetical protein
MNGCVPSGDMAVGCHFGWSTGDERERYCLLAHSLRERTGVGGSAAAATLSEGGARLAEGVRPRPQQPQRRRTGRRGHAKRDDSRTLPSARGERTCTNTSERTRGMRQNFSLLKVTLCRDVELNSASLFFHSSATFLNGPSLPSVINSERCMQQFK